MIREIIIYLGISKPANFLWDIIYPHTSLHKKRIKALQVLLKDLVRPGDLVFDVGANTGRYTNLFLSMQVEKVIAIEPNARLAMKIQHPQVQTLNVAVDSFSQFAKYYISDVHGLSTLSQSYKSLSRYKKITWNNPVTIFTTTLDDIANEYGIPDFIKIDVEGYEKEVLTGMNFAPRALSFEFVSEHIQDTIQCILKLDSLDKYQYTYTIGLEPDMKFEMFWSTSKKLLEHISYISKPAWGDVWVRRKE